MKKPAPESVRASRSGAGASFFERAGALLIIALHTIAFKNKEHDRTHYERDCDVPQILDCCKNSSTEHPCQHESCNKLTNMAAHVPPPFIASTRSLRDLKRGWTGDI